MLFAPLPMLGQIIQESLRLCRGPGVASSFLRQLGILTNTLALFLVFAEIAVLQHKGAWLVTIVADLALCASVLFQTFLHLLLQLLEMLRANKMVTRRHVAHGIRNISVIVFVIAIHSEDRSLWARRHPTVHALVVVCLVQEVEHVVCL
jgi:hypothetical protein